MDFATGYFVCPKCGNDTFIAYPQTISLDRTEMRTFEYTCVKCKRTTAIKEVAYGTAVE